MKSSLKKLLLAAIVLYMAVLPTISFASAYNIDSFFKLYLSSLESGLAEVHSTYQDLGERLADNFIQLAQIGGATNTNTDLILNSTPATVVTPNDSNLPTTFSNEVALNTETQTTQTIVERITERVVSGVSLDYLNSRLQELDNKFKSQIANITGAPSATGTGTTIIYQSSGNIDAQLANLQLQISASNKIDSLGSIDIANSDWTGGTIANTSITGSSWEGTTGVFSSSLSGASLSTSGQLTISGTATSTAAGDFAFDTDTLYVDSINNRVAIGTTSPKLSLHVTGTDGIVIPFGTTAQRPTARRGILRYNTTTSQFEGYSGTAWAGLGGVIDVDGNTYILAESAAGANEDTLFFNTAGSERMRITSNGNVGIGTTSPYAKLSVVGASGVVAAKFHATSTTATSTFAGGLTTGTCVFIVLAIGWVGVGTASPSDLLSVYTTKTSTSSAAPNSINLGGTYGNATDVLKLKLYDDGSAVYGFGVSTAQLNYLVASGLADHVFYQSTTELMRIKGNGFVGIGSGANVNSALDILPVTLNYSVAGISGVSVRDHTQNLSGANPTTYATFFASKIGAMTLTGTNAGQTVTDAAGLSVSNPIKSTNVAITNSHGILIPVTAVSTATNSYGLTVNTPTGATNNYAAAFLGGNVGIGVTNPSQKLVVAGNIGLSVTGSIHSTNSSAGDGNGLFSLLLEKTPSGAALLTGGSTIIRTYNGAGTNQGFMVQGSNGASGYTSLMEIAGNGQVYLPGNVGIGTTSPYAKLSVVGASGVVAAKFHATSTTATSTFMGKVGIGTASPNNKIQVVDLIDFDNTDFNTRLGFQAGKNIVSGATWNTFVGYQAGYLGVMTNAADANSALGYQALRSLTTGSSNTAVGYLAGNNITTGIGNVALGQGAMNGITTGNQNIAIGQQAFLSALSGSHNIGMGQYTGQSITSGARNIGLGSQALYGLSTGSSNIGIGYNAGVDLTTGSQNIIIGYYPSQTGGVTSGSNNILIGQDIRIPSQTASGQLNIGNLMYATSLGTGATMSTGNFGIASTSPWRKLSVTGTVGFSSTLSAESGNDEYLCIDPTTYEVTAGGAACGASSERYKENIETLRYGLEDILKLESVSYDFKDTKKKGLGFIAEKVVNIIPDVVEIRDGLAESITYDAFIPILTKAIQEIWGTVQDIIARVTGLEGKVSSLEARIAALENATAVGGALVQDETVVEEDTAPPTIEIQGANPAVIEIGTSYMDLGAIVTDDTGVELSYTIHLDGEEVSSVTLDTTAPRTYTITYKAIDAAGNLAEASRAVEIIDSSTSETSPEPQLETETPVQ